MNADGRDPQSPAGEAGRSPLVGAFTRPVHAVVVGASRGIGRAFAELLAADPCVHGLVATSRAPQAGDPRGAPEGARVHRVAMDVADEESVTRAAAEITRLLPRVDLLVNCAGVLHEDDGLWPERRLAEVRPENLQRAFAVNATGPLLLAKHLHPLLERRERVVLATLSARVGSIGDNRLGGWYAYRASKAAQNMITRNLSIELARRARGLVCVALHPGTVRTDLSEPFRARVPEGRLFEPERAARQLLEVLDSLDVEHNGRFFAWDGQEIPW